MNSLDQRIKQAETADGDELWVFVRDPHPMVTLNATINRNLTEEMAVFIAKKRGATAEALGALANDIRFRDSYKLKLALCRNPKTPQRVIFSLLKYLRIFDLGDLTRDHTVPVTVRQKIELLIAEKIPSMPSGVKMALARRSSSAIVMMLMERGDSNVIRTCLDSPIITESHICSIINRYQAKPLIVQLASAHQKWSLRYAVRFALIRNYHTPMKHVISFIPEMKTSDLRELYTYESLPGSTRPYIFYELRQRGETVDRSSEEVYELPDDDTGDECYNV